jgi:hypothetical protein
VIVILFRKRAYGDLSSLCPPHPKAQVGETRGRHALGRAIFQYCFPMFSAKGKVMALFGDSSTRAVYLLVIAV